MYKAQTAGADLKGHTSRRTSPKRPTVLNIFSNPEELILFLCQLKLDFRWNCPFPCSFFLKKGVNLFINTSARGEVLPFRPLIPPLRVNTRMQAVPQRTVYIAAYFHNAVIVKIIHLFLYARAWANRRPPSHSRVVRSPCLSVPSIRRSGEKYVLSRHHRGRLKQWYLVWLRIRSSA